MNLDADTGSEDSQHQDRARITEEDARKLLEQLRSAPAEEIITDVFSTLLNAAQVKLGRRDARLFIDLCAVMFDYAGGHVSEDLRRQVEQALGQLRLGQVSAETQVAKGGVSEPNDLEANPTPPTTGHAWEPPSGGDAASSQLWVPGR